jgi:hypothetical protein
MRPDRRIFGACLVATLLAGLLPAPAVAREIWGPFRGQVVDAETGTPIAGAVVLVVWWEADPTPVQTRQKFYDAREAVTDADGRFELPRLSPPFFTFRISDPRFTYFAPGYVIDKVVVDPPDGERFVAPTVIQMRRLGTREELLRKSRSTSTGIPLSKIPRLLEAINAERRMLGLPPEGQRRP